MSAQRVSAIDLQDDGPEVIVRNMLTPDRAIDDFLDDGLRQGWSERTLHTYRRILYAFADRLPLDYDISDVREDDVRRYLGSKKGRARGTIAHAEAVLSSFFRWCYLNRKVKANPMDRIQRTKRIKAEDLNVVWVSTDDARKLLAAASVLDLTHDPVIWTHRICGAVLLSLGPRRQAVANLRRRNYDRVNSRIRFHEKGNKTIWKPVPDELAALLDAADAAGVWERPTDFLIPPPPGAWYDQAVLDGERERDGRCIWDLVKKIGKQAGVETHVHALRAAFAIFYLSNNPGDIKGLQELLGHANIATTAMYLRKLEKATAMEPVRSLAWGVA